MNISLTPELQKMIEAKVNQGLYTSASEVIREALRLLAEEDELRVLRRKELQSKIQKGLDSLKSGRGVDSQEVFKKLEARLSKLEKT